MKRRYQRFDTVFAQRSACAWLLPFIACYVTGCDGPKTYPDDQPCANLCDDVDTSTFPGCDVTCGIDAADQVQAGAVIQVFGVGLGASGSADDPQTCELAVSNCQLSECEIIYATCLNETDDTGCADLYSECLAEEAIEAREVQCSGDYETCTGVVGDAYAICEDQAQGTQEKQDCETAEQDGMNACSCDELACNGDDDAAAECRAQASASSSTTTTTSGPVQVGPNHWLVPRALLNAEFGHLGELQQATGATLSRRKGQPDYDGVRLWWLDRHGPLRGLGLRARDRLLSVNGKPLRGKNLSLPVLAPLASAKSLELKLERGTKTLTLLYEITDGTH